MRKLCIAVICLLFIAKVQAQDRYWVGPTSGGNWTTSANWSLAAGGAGGAGAPTSLQNAIFSGFTGTVNFDAASITINSLRVINNSQLVLSNPVTTTKTITPNDGASSSQDLLVDATSRLTLTTGTGISSTFILAPHGALVDGTVVLAGGTSNLNGGRLDASNATVASPVEFNGTLELGEGSSNTNGTNFKFNSGSFYIIKKNGGNVPAGVWNANATIEYRGGQTVQTTSGPTLNGPPSGGFGKFIWNVTNQSQTVNLSLTTLGVIFNGDFNVLNTNNQILRMASNLNGAQIKGNLNIDGGSIVSMTNGTTAPASGTSLTLNGNLVITNGSFNLQENSSGASSLLKLGGNLVIGAQGTLNTSATAATNEIELNGTAQQTISVNGTISGATRLRLNSASGALATTNVTLPSSTNSRLTLTAGNLDMGGNLLSIQNPATTAVTGGTVSSHIIGKLRRATNTAGAAYLFPVSPTATELGAVKIYPVDAAANEYEVEFFRPNTYPRNAGDMPSGVMSASNFYWMVGRPVGTSSADLEIVYGNLSLGGGITNAADVRILRWNGASPWENLGGTDAGGGAVGVTGISSFGPLALGSVSQMLPVRLLSFSGLRQGGTNHLKWTTAMEVNNRGFHIERSSDGLSYQVIGFVASRASGGNTTTGETYAFSEGSPGGRQFYRLRQTDRDGRESYSPVVLIKGQTSAAIELLNLAPNPVRGTINLWLHVPARQYVDVQVYDFMGRLAKRSQHLVTEGSNNLLFSTSELAPGSYLLRVGSKSGEVIITKFTKE